MFWVGKLKTGYTHTDVARLQRTMGRRKPFEFCFSFGTEAATVSCASLVSACQNTIPGTTHGDHKKKTRKKTLTAPAPQAVMDSIKSNSATVAHFKVNLSQHFDIFKNKALPSLFQVFIWAAVTVKKKRRNVPLTKRFQFRSVEGEL